jgi:hypothetical protein
VVHKDKDVFILYSTRYLITHSLRGKGKDKSRDRAIAQVVSRRHLTAAIWVDPRSDHVGFVVDKVALGLVFSEYFGFPFQLLFRRLLHTHLSSEAGTVDPPVVVARRRTKWTPSHPTPEIKKR